MPGRTKLRSRRSPLAIKVGAAVRLARTSKGLTQERLAEEAALSKNSVGNIERGEFDVTVSTLSRIAHALGRKGADILLAAGV